jgi:ribosomal protein S18 acetylase RimI-like enzyme
MSPGIRWLVPTDLNTLVVIDKSCFGAHAWDAAEFEAFFDKERHAGLVAAPSGKVAGYLLYGLDPLCHRGGIVRLAVRPSQQRRGLATALVRYLLDRMHLASLFTVLALARDRELPYHLFLAANGFRAVEVRRGLFGADDGYLFVHQVPEHQR